MRLSEGASFFGHVAEAPSPPATEAAPSPSPAEAVALVHEEIDRRTHSFGQATGLRCPTGCGACCQSPSVETTAIDVLPLAMEIVHRGRAGEVLAHLEARADDRRCVLYEPEGDDGQRGRCTMYAWRPSICRLFGFAGRRDGDGRPQFTACRVHGRVMPDIVAAARADVQAGRVELPIFADLAGRVALLDPGRAGRVEPINDALRAAIHAAGLAARLSAIETAGEIDGDVDGTRPQTPRRPRAPRRAA